VDAMIEGHRPARNFGWIMAVSLAIAILLAGVSPNRAWAEEEAPSPQPNSVLEKPNTYSSPSVKSPTPTEWFSEFYEWGSNNLTGSWFGARSFLGDHGVVLDILYVAIPTGNLSGGLDTGFFGGGPLGVTLTVDTERLIGWQGGTLFIDWEFFSWYNSRYSPTGSYDPTGSYVGSNTNFIDASESHLNQIAQLYYRQSLFDDRLSIQLGKMDSNVIFAAVEAAGAFQDSIAMYSSTLNPYFPTYPNESTAIAATLAPVEFFSFSAGLFDGTTAAYDRATGMSGPATGPRGPDTFFNNDGHWFVIAQANAFWEIDPSRPGSVGIGGWVQTGATQSPSTDLVVENVPGALLQWQQTLWAPTAKLASQGGGIRFFGQFGWSDPEKNPIHWSLMAGFSATGIIPRRPADALGLMGAYSRFTHDHDVYRSQLPTGTSTGPGGGTESSIEAFYLAQITASMYLQPGLLWIRTPGGGNPAPLGNALTLYLLFGVNL
ncbi:MAG: carbohydrate porin, partial [Myxococcota bacterium]